MYKSLVSIIVPVFNTEAFLSKCLDSLYIQTYKNIEVVVVNDGSEDNSQAIIDAFTEKDSRFISVVKENGGLSDARNAGMKTAKGEYFAFVDSDDWVEPNFIEEMIILSEKHKAELVICNLDKVNEKDEIFKTLTQISHLGEKIILKEDFSLFGELSWFACNKLFKKELFNGIEFTKGIHFEDIATIPKLLLKCNVVAKTNKALYHYFERTGSITQSFTAKGLDMFTAINEVKVAFNNSIYKKNIIEWKRFVIIQCFYSFVAYAARVKEKELQNRMYLALKKTLEKEEVTKKSIFIYKRNGKNYIFGLSIIKNLYYNFVILFKI